MKIATSNNAELVIETRSGSDYQHALKVANRMVENSQQSIEIASVEDGLFVHLCSVWDNFQRQELRDEYLIAKKETEK